MDSEAGALMRPIILTGRFRSGTTILWQILRRIEATHAFFEPLHDDLWGHLRAGSSPEPDRVTADAFLAGYEGRRAVLDLHDPAFGVERLCLAAGEEHASLERYLLALIRSCARARPLLACGRTDLRLPWLRRVLPGAALVSVQRAPRDLWRAMQMDAGPEGRPDPFLSAGHDLGLWAASLAPSLPEIAAPRFGSAYEIVYLLGRISRTVAERYADVVIDCDRELLADPAGTLSRLFRGLGLDSAARPGLVEGICGMEYGGGSDDREATPFDEIESHADDLLDRSGLLEQIDAGVLDAGSWPRSPHSASSAPLLSHLAREISRQRRAVVSERVASDRSARGEGRRGPRIAVFTIGARNYLAHARALLAGVAEHHPDCDRVLVLSDRIDGAFDPAAEDFEVVEAEALGIDELADMAFRYEITEFATAIKPAAFRFLLDRDRYDAVLYLDPDVYLLSPMEELLECLAAGAEAVLTPHICAPVEDGRKPDDHSMLQSGVYNLGFLALAPGEETSRFLAWWQRRLVRDCRIDLTEGLFVDQKWADLLPGFVERTRILRHPGYNLAYWNLMHRKVSRVEGRWLANELPIRFVHFSGMVGSDARVFSRHQQRFTVSNIGELQELFRAYRSRLESMGWADCRSLPYAYGDASGRPIPEILRRLYREQVRPGDPAGPDPVGEAVRLGNQADPRVPSPEGLLVTRLMTRVRDQRPDLADAFDLQTAPGRRGFVEWFLHSAADELSLDATFTAEVERRYRSSLAVEQGSAAVSGPRGDPRRSLVQRAAVAALAHAHRVKRLYLRVPVPIRHRVKTALLRTAYRPETPRSAPRLPVGARLIGYPRAELGMGEHVRLTAVALDAVRFPFALYDFSANVVARQRDERFASWVDNESVFNVNLFHINADQMAVARDTLGEPFFRGRYNVGYWAWELSRFPLEWKPALEMVDEVWAPSRFVEESIAATSDRPVVWMPIAVRVEAPRSIGRSHFGLPADRFVFLFSFDYSSFATRKNPGGVIEAFRRAFGPDRSDVLLVIKSMARDWHRVELAALRAEAAGDPRIRLIDGVFAPEEIVALTNACDCFVSLHRSEGFGRGMAEAMALGKPVIATGYSGNTDYMGPETSCLVDYTLVPVRDGEYPHPDGQVWAEPDLDHAAWHMRRLIGDPAATRRLGARARQHIEQGWGPATVGARIRERLRELGLA